MARVKDLFYFKIEVREGAPGCADDEWYTSKGYKTFQDAYRDLVDFEILERWPQLRHVQKITIWKEGGKDVNVKPYNNCIEVADLPLLGVTEKEFDELLAKLSAKYNVGINCM